MAATRFKGLTCGVLVVAGIAVMLVLQYQRRAKLEKENESLRQQLDGLDAIKEENAQLSNQLAQARTSFTDKERNELFRLRSEVGLLRKETNELGRLREDYRRLQKSLAERPSTTNTADEESVSEYTKLVVYPKLNDAKALCFGFVLYANDNGSRLPTNLDDAAGYLKAPDGPSFSGTNQFELVYHGLLNQLTNPATVILVRESAPWQTPEGKWAKTYGFADGHSEVHSEPDGNFEPWEKKHTVSPQSAQ
jgi:hypothetical protein